MDKEKILSKSKKENIYGDEREKLIRIHRDSFSLWGALGLGLIVIVIKILKGHSPADIISIFFCISSIGFLYEGITLKNKWQFLVGIFMLLLTIYFFYIFCKRLF